MLAAGLVALAASFAALGGSDHAFALCAGVALNGLHTPEAEDRVVGALRASRPLTDWLDEHVGASELERSR